MGRNRPNKKTWGEHNPMSVRVTSSRFGLAWADVPRLGGCPQVKPALATFVLAAQRFQRGSASAMSRLSASSSVISSRRRRWLSNQGP